jgi:hypothetical protein
LVDPVDGADVPADSWLSPFNKQAASRIKTVIVTVDDLVRDGIP